MELLDEQERTKYIVSKVKIIIITVNVTGTTIAMTFCSMNRLALDALTISFAGICRQ